MNRVFLASLLILGIVSIGWWSAGWDNNIRAYNINADGTVYVSGNIYDSTIYGAAAGVGAAKQCWVSADGKIYAP